MNVNSHSQSLRGCFRSLTVAWVAILWAMPAEVYADRVVLLPVEGAPQEVVEEVEQQLVVTLRELGHEPTSDAVPSGVETPPPPESLEDFLAIAGMQQADWALDVRVESASDRSYWLRFRAASVAASRLEELRAEVKRAHEAERLRALLSALLRSEGLGSDAERLGGADPFVPPPPPSSERLANEAEAGSEPGADDAPAEKPEPNAAPASGDEASTSPASPADASPPRRADAGWYVTGAASWRPIVGHDPRARGGSIWGVGLRLGRGMERGLHWRAGLDLALGDSNGITLLGGGVYDVLQVGPMRFGALGEVGVHKATSGNDVWQLAGRLGVVGRMPMGSQLFVEATLPEVTWLSANGGGWLLGGAVRLGVALP